MNGKSRERARDDATSQCIFPFGSAFTLFPEAFAMVGLLAVSDMEHQGPEHRRARRLRPQT